LLMELNDETFNQQCFKQFQSANNMTDVLSSLVALVNSHSEYKSQALSAFYQKWKNDPLVMDKWFMVQAASHLPGTLDVVKNLMRDPVFDIKNPNKVRALIGVFCHGNPVNFHSTKGDGYEFLTQCVLELDLLNPQIAAGVLKAMTRWHRYDKSRQSQMKQSLEMILSKNGLSKDCYEIANKCLG